MPHAASQSFVNSFAATSVSTPLYANEAVPPLVNQMSSKSDTTKRIAKLEEEKLLSESAAAVNPINLMRWTYFLFSQNRPGSDSVEINTTSMAG